MSQIDSASDGHPLAPPPSAFPPAPRPVRLRHIPYAIILSLLFMAVVGVVMFMMIVFPLILAAAGDWLGTAAPGRITDKTTRGRGNSTCVVHFTYPVDNQDYTFEMDVEADSFENVKIGDPVRVRVVPIVPSLAAIEEPALERSWNTVLCVGWVAGWNSMLVWIVWMLGRSAIRWRRLVRLGIPTLGRISDKRVGVGKGTTLLLTYHFQVRKQSEEDSADCTEHEATVSVRRKDFEAAQVGQLVTVLFDPENPDDSMIYRCGEYEAVGIG